METQPGPGGAPSNFKTLLRIVGILAGIGVLLFGLMGIGLWLLRPYLPGAAPAAPAGQYVTIDGRDVGGAIIDPINVWDNYTTRGAVVARLHHGDRVQMIGQSGDGVQIQTDAGVRGWLTNTFIRELK